MEEILDLKNICIITILIQLNFLAAGQVITVRGCAPFPTEVFPMEMQRGMVGNYWKVIIKNQNKIVL